MRLNHHLIQATCSHLSCRITIVRVPVAKVPLVVLLVDFLLPVFRVEMLQMMEAVVQVTRSSISEKE